MQGSGAFENGRRRRRASSGRKVARHPEEGLHKHRRCGRCRLMFQMTGFLGAQRQTKGRQRAGKRQIQSLFQPCSPPPVAHFGCAHVCAPMFNIRFRTIHRLGSANSVTRRAVVPGPSLVLDFDVPGRPLRWAETSVLFRRGYGPWAAPAVAQGRSPVCRMALLAWPAPGQVEPLLKKVHAQQRCHSKRRPALGAARRRVRGNERAARSHQASTQFISSGNSRLRVLLDLRSNPAQGSSVSC